MLRLVGDPPAGFDSPSTSFSAPSALGSAEESR
jgi:hypothetical protein